MIKNSGLSIWLNNAEWTLIITLLKTHDFSEPSEMAVADRIVKKIYERIERNNKRIKG